MKTLHTYYFKLTTLSPVHIGTGDSYEPTSFVIDDDRIYEFDEVLFYRSLSELEKKALENKMSDWMQIIDFYKEHALKAKQLSKFSCEVTQKVAQRFKTALNKDGSRNKNQFEIHKTFKNPNTYRAIIPGSSIKGMIDTVLKIYARPEVASNEVRQKLIVSDAMLFEGDVEVGYCYRKHKNPSKDTKNPIPQIIEIIKPGSIFVLTIKSELDLSEIQQKINHYLQQRREESRIANYSQKEFVARIGKYSGKPYMVYDSRDMKNSYGKPVATHTLYEKNDAPFGWVQFESIEKDNYEKLLKDIKEQEHTYFLEREKRQAHIRSKIDKESRLIKEQVLEKERLKKEQERIEQKAKDREEAILASLSPIEKLIHQLENEKTNPNETKDVTIFNAIQKGKFDCIDNGKCKALKILKEEMIQLKKWVESSKKPEKDKKYKRTQEVIKLLKECHENPPSSI